MTEPHRWTPEEVAAEKLKPGQAWRHGVVLTPEQKAKKNEYYRNYDAKERWAAMGFVTHG